MKLLISACRDYILPDLKSVSPYTKEGRADRIALIERALAEAEAESEVPRIIVCTQGGVVVGVRANESVSIDVLDQDDLEAAPDGSEEQRDLQALDTEYENLPLGVY